MAGRPLEWRHGYEIMKLTGIKSGTLYPMLIRLHEQGHLETRWVPAVIEGRPPRHAYRLTPSGLKLARSINTSDVGSSARKEGFAL